MANVAVRRGPWGLAAAVAWVVVSGCGGDSGELPAVPAGGTATFQGKPISKGTIHFQPEKGRPASGPIEGGKFTLTTYKDGDGAVAGKHLVGVEVTEEVKDKDGDTTVKYIVPQKFANPTSSKITAEVPPGGKTDIVIDVKDAK
jgi:hypothetical protein